MRKGNFYKEIPWDGVNWIAEILGEYRREKGVTQQGGADNNWNWPFPLLSAPPPPLRVFKKYPLDIALVIGYVDFSF
jgi:hypothetical protein